LLASFAKDIVWCFVVASNFCPFSTGDVHHYHRSVAWFMQWLNLFLAVVKWT
jgi:hypothetical protein